MRTLFTFLLLAVLAVPFQGRAEDTPVSTSLEAKGIRPDFTLELASGETVLLAGILPPAAVLATQAEAEPWQEQALALLRTIAQGHSLRLVDTEIPRDRHGHRPGQVFLADSPETWLQGALVREGLAVVQGAPARRAGQAELLALEDEA
ncbi:thermonuclease family protein, partial [Fodinicurvata halophila]